MSLVPRSRIDNEIVLSARDDVRLAYVLRHFDHRPGPTILRAPGVSLGWPGRTLDVIYDNKARVAEAGYPGVLVLTAGECAGQ